MTLSLFGICFLEPNCTEAISPSSLEEEETERNIDGKKQKRKRKMSFKLKIEPGD